jgi:hypothetical protein
MEDFEAAGEKLAAFYFSKNELSLDKIWVCEKIKHKK